MLNLWRGQIPTKGTSFSTHQKYSFFNDFVYFHHVHLWFLWSVFCGTMPLELPHKKSHGIVFHISTIVLLQPFSWIYRLLSKENLLTWVLNVPQMASLCFIGDCVNLCLTNASKSMRPALNFTPMSALHHCTNVQLCAPMWTLHCIICVCECVC